MWHEEVRRFHAVNHNGTQVRYKAARKAHAQAHDSIKHCVQSCFYVYVRASTPTRVCVCVRVRMRMCGVSVFLCRCDSL